MSVLAGYKYKKQYLKLIVAGLLFYTLFISIKLAYSAQMVDIIAYYKKTKSEVAVGITIYYVIYAISQFLLSLFVHKIGIKKFLFITSIFSCVTFAMIGISSELWQVWVFFGLNGFFQASGWGGINHILSNRLPGPVLSLSSKILMFGSSIGNALTYGVSALCMHLFSWKITFVVFGVILLVAIFNLFWQDKQVAKVNAIGDEVEKTYTVNVKQFIVPTGRKLNVAFMMAVFAILSFFGSSIYYGISNWVPALLMEVHGFPSTLSVFITLFFPLIELFAILFTFSYFDKTNKIFRTGAITTSIIIAILLLFVFFYDSSFLFAICGLIVLRLFVASFYVNFNSYAINKFKNYFNIGTTMLVTNACASCGAGTMPLITALIMDAFGWSAYFIFLLIICLIAFILVLSSMIFIKKKFDISDCV